MLSINYLFELLINLQDALITGFFGKLADTTVMDAAGTGIGAMPSNSQSIADMS